MLICKNKNKTNESGRKTFVCDLRSNRLFLLYLHLCQFISAFNSTKAATSFSCLIINLFELFSGSFDFFTHFSETGILPTFFEQFNPIGYIFNSRLWNVYLQNDEFPPRSKPWQEDIKFNTLDFDIFCLCKSQIELKNLIKNFKLGKFNMFFLKQQRDICKKNWHFEMDQQLHPDFGLFSGTIWDPPLELSALVIFTWVPPAPSVFFTTS